MEQEQRLQTLPVRDSESVSKSEEFDAEEYIRKRMMEIESLQERSLYKEMVGGILYKLYEFNKQSYEDLAQKILNECKPKQDEYAIDVSMTSKDRYDATDSFLYPMRADDVKEVEVSYQDIQTAYKRDQTVKLYTIFLEADYPTIYHLLQQNPIFHGTVKTKKKEYEATFQVSRNQEYLAMVEQLYYIFALNYQSWVTVCTAYLMKLLDVNLTSIEGWNEEEIIDEIQVDFAIYKEIVRYHPVPLWNLKHLQMSTDNYPESSVVKINYDHQIYAHGLKQECAYLVMDTNVEISNIRRVHGDLFISCPDSRPHDWNLYQVGKEDKKTKYPYPVLTNRRKESFAGGASELFQKNVKTKAEVARIVESFTYHSHVRLLKIQMHPSPPKGYEATNYSMDAFMIDEIRTGNTKETLLLSFMEIGKSNIIHLDRMNFLVTQVQKLFPEYLCIGELLPEQVEEET